MQGKQPETPFIKASEPPKVPAMFLIPPDAQEQQYAAMRQKLVSKHMK